MFFAVLDRTYVKIAENVKIVPPPTRKPLFSFPRAPQDPSKIDQKAVPREIYVQMYFQHPLKAPPEALLGHLKTIF